MKKTICILAVFAAVGVAVAGLDLYTGVRFTSLLDPVGWSNTGTDSNINSTVTGTDCMGLVGNGALIVGLSSGNGAGTMTATFYACATTNGTYYTITNNSVALTCVVTGGAARRVVQIVPNSQGRYWRCVATPSGAATGQCASAVLVSY